MSELSDLIKSGEDLKVLDYDDPDQGLWNNDVKAVVKPYGDATMEVLERAMYSSSVSFGPEGRRTARIENIGKVQKLLSSLEKRTPERQASQSAIISSDFEEARAASRQQP